MLKNVFSETCAVFLHDETCGRAIEAAENMAYTRCILDE